MRHFTDWKSETQDGRKQTKQTKKNPTEPKPKASSQQF